jgi:AAA+ ATPase superfamily predicted ATPase
MLKQKIKPGFIGRNQELKDLERLFRKKTSSLVVIQGRRRIGKSRLAQEFGKKHYFLQLSGMPPSVSTTAQSQRNEIMNQFCQASGMPDTTFDDWSKIFAILAREARGKKTVILLDEISWMGSKDPDFLGKLKNAWDLYFKENQQLVLILCGSISTWIEENILSSTGFMGRISLILTLNELNLNECYEFLGDDNRSSYEIFRILSVTGGIPRYLEEVQMDLSAEENIRHLCFSQQGILFREFEDIFSDLFSKKSELYKKIVSVLVEGKNEYNDICKALVLPKNGHLSDYLTDLLKSGFIARDYTWHLTSGETSRLSHYRLRDNYLRFYLKYVDKNRAKIGAGHFNQRSLTSFPGWESIMGLQFENLVLNNRQHIWNNLSIYNEEIVSDNPFFQRKTTTTSGCQIDYLIHTKFNTLYLCEIKFSKNPVGAGVISEVSEKINCLKRPRGFSCIPILIHVNGVQDSVIENGFFKNIIDFSSFLTYQNS